MLAAIDLIVELLFLLGYFAYVRRDKYGELSNIAEMESNN